MKTILKICFIFLTLNTSAQNTEFTFTKDGLTDFVVTSTEGKTQNEIYNKANEWILKTYKNPDEVIKAKIENEYIKIQGSSKILICFNTLGTTNCNTSRYTIEISFKEGRYKFDVINLEYLHETSWLTLNVDDKAHLYYNKKGEIRSIYKNFPDIATYFNTLNNDLKDYILGNKKETEKSDW